MAWKIEIVPAAVKELAKLDPPAARRILKFLNERVTALDDPRSIGEPLVGPLSLYWKYRVGDYRLISLIEDHVLQIIVVKIGNRREVYKR